MIKANGQPLLSGSWRSPRLAILIAAGAFMVCAPAVAGPIWYEVVPLGGLGGEWSAASAINSSGLAVGTAALPSGAISAFVDGGAGAVSPGWGDGVQSSRAKDVNDSDHVVGTSYTARGARATLWRDGEATLLGGLEGGESYGNAINQAGAVAGGLTNAAGEGSAFLYDGKLVDVGADTGMQWSAAFGINDAGAVVGYGEAAPGAFRGFVWRDGAATELGTFGGRSSYAFGINASGAAAGHAQTVGGYSHAFLFDGLMRDLGTLGGSSSYGYGINSAGWVVGYSWTSGDLDTRAFLFDGTTMIDLNRQLAGGAGWLLEEAYGINDAGQIVGVGFYGGRRAAFRLDPLSSDVPIVPNPEPASLFMMGFGLVLLALWQRMRGS